MLNAPLFVVSCDVAFLCFRLSFCCLFLFGCLFSFGFVCVGVSPLLIVEFALTHFSFRGVGVSEPWCF